MSLLSSAFFPCSFTLLKIIFLVYFKTISLSVIWWYDFSLRGTKVYSLQIYVDQTFYVGSLVSFWSIYCNLKWVTHFSVYILCSSFFLYFMFKNWLIRVGYTGVHKGDIQKVRSLRIPEFLTPLPPCLPFFVFEHAHPFPSKVCLFWLEFTLSPLNFYTCEI